MPYSIGPKIKPILHYLPLVLAILAIVLVIKGQPQAVRQLVDQIEVKLNLKQPTTLTPQDPLPVINTLRQTKKLKPLNQSDKLNETAKLLALSIIDTKGDETKMITVKQAALANDYQYLSIAYLAAIDSLPLIQQPTTSWIQSEDKDLLATNYTQIGVAQVENNGVNPKQLVTVLVLAQPQTSTPQTNLPVTSQASSRPNYTGVQLWAEIQKYRKDHGVPEFRQDNVLCTLASIRVTHLVELGKLDDHQGFSPLVDQYRKNGQLTYGNLAENILMGYPTPQTAVAGWDGSLGHQALMKDGSYVWGCAAANSGFAVLIAAY